MKTSYTFEELKAYADLLITDYKYAIADDEEKGNIGHAKRFKSRIRELESFIEDISEWED